MNLGARFAVTAAGARKFLLQARGQPKAGTVGDMHAGERRKNPLLTDRVARVELRERPRQQLLQNRHRPFRHPLLQCFRRNVHREVERRRFGGQVWHGRCGRTPSPTRDQRQKQVPGNLRRALHELGAPGPRLQLGARKELW